MGYWNREYRLDLYGWKVSRINDPSAGNIPQKNIIWLDEEPTDLDPTNMFYIEFDPNAIPELLVLDNLPGNNATDAGATYVPLGTSKTFEITVDGGIPPYSYAWYRRASSTDNPVGSNSPSYTISSYASGNNGDYFCRVTDSAGQTTETLRERTKVAVRITTDLPEVATWTSGVSNTLSIVAADGLAPLSYEWQRSVDLGLVWVTISGQTTATLTYDTTTNSEGLYRCIVTSSNTQEPRTATSSSCAVSVVSPSEDPDTDDAAA